MKVVSRGVYKKFISRDVNRILDFPKKPLPYRRVITVLFVITSANHVQTDRLISGNDTF